MDGCDKASQGRLVEDGHGWSRHDMAGEARSRPSRKFPLWHGASRPGRAGMAPLGVARWDWAGVVWIGTARSGTAGNAGLRRARAGVVWLGRLGPDPVGAGRRWARLGTAGQAWRGLAWCGQAWSRIWHGRHGPICLVMLGGSWQAWHGSVGQDRDSHGRRGWPSLVTSCRGTARHGRRGLGQERRD